VPKRQVQRSTDNDSHGTREVEKDSSIDFLPPQETALKQLINLDRDTRNPYKNPSTEQLSSDENAILRRLSDGLLDQTDAVTPEFNNVLSRDTLIGYLKRAQLELGYEDNNSAFARYLCVNPRHIREAYAGKVSVEKMHEWLASIGYEIRSRLITPEHRHAPGAAATAG